MTRVHQADNIAGIMLKTLLRIVARVLSVLFAGSALISLVGAGPDLQGPVQVVTARVLAIVIPAALAWFLWRVASERAASTESAQGAGGGR